MCKIAIMATMRIEIGRTGERVAANLVKLRHDAHLSQRDLSERLSTIGRPLSPSVLSKIEKLDRRIDVDDLIALVIALDVCPNRLLMADVAVAPRLTCSPGATNFISTYSMG